MSDVLCADFRVDGARKPSQLWPLLFAAMHQAGLGFHGPYDAEGTGRIMYSNRDDEADVVVESVTTQRLWDLVRTEPADLTVYFWTSGDGPYEVWLSLICEPSASGPIWASMLPIESLMGDDKVKYSQQELAQRICRWIGSVRDVTMSCDLHEGLIYWQKEDWLVGYVGTPRNLECPTTQTSTTLQWQMTTGDSLSLISPLPVPHIIGHDFIDLGGCE